MTDPRNLLFSEIHRTWLKPLDFRKKENKSEKNLGGGVVHTVVLESYPAILGGPYRFSIKVLANWNDSRQDKINYCMYLPGYVTKIQFWVVEESTKFGEVSLVVKDQFKTFALPALHKMESLTGLLELFQEIPSHITLAWYFESYLNLLNRLGRRQEGKQLLLKVIDSAPHEGIAQRARNLLAQQEAPF